MVTFTAGSLGIRGLVENQGRPGRYIYNEGSNAFTLFHQDGAAAAAERFICPGNTDLVLDPGAAALVWYDTADSRNRVVAVSQLSAGGGGNTPRQEAVTTEVITGTDTAITDTLDNTPVSNASVKLFFNGVLATQGAGADYTISGSTITWLASSGTAPDMDTNDELIAVYAS
jgi:hypothetical protein